MRLPWCWNVLLLVVLGCSLQYKPAVTQVLAAAKEEHDYEYYNGNDIDISEDDEEGEGEAEEGEYGDEVDEDNEEENENDNEEEEEDDEEEGVYDEDEVEPFEEEDEEDHDSEEDDEEEHRDTESEDGEEEEEDHEEEGASEAEGVKQSVENPADMPFRQRKKLEESKRQERRRQLEEEANQRDAKLRHARTPDRRPGSSSSSQEETEIARDRQDNEAEVAAVEINPSGTIKGNFHSDQDYEWPTIKAVESSDENAILFNAHLLEKQGLPELEDLSKMREMQVSAFDEVNKRLENIVLQMEELGALHRDLKTRTKQLEQSLYSMNQRQLDSLTEAFDSRLQKEKERMDTVKKLRAEEADEINKGTITIPELERIFNKTEIALTMDSLMEGRVLSKLDDFVEEVVKSEAVAAAHTTTKKKELAPTVQCITPVEAVQMVQNSLMTFSQDVVGLQDHALGAGIIYSLTSDTYSPPEDEQAFGTVWWRRFIPEDWERLLPDGWEDWNIAIPGYLYHSFGLEGASTASPTTVFDPNTNVGSCWPMDGPHGQITFRLPYPVEVESVTIDHVSSRLVDTSSAPRLMRVIGYPPCKSCPHSFNENIAVELGHIQYQQDSSRPIQTFSLVQKDPGIDMGTCGEETDSSLSCSADSYLQSSPRMGASVHGGITLVVEENWGNDDCTCLYRFRVHGKRVDEE